MVGRGEAPELDRNFQRIFVWSVAPWRSTGPDVISTCVVNAVMISRAFRFVFYTQGGGRERVNPESPGNQRFSGRQVRITSWTSVWPGTGYYRMRVRISSKLGAVAGRHRADAVRQG